MYDTLKIEREGHSWITGDRPPEITGWRCAFVNHYGTERTVFVYRRAA